MSLSGTRYKVLRTYKGINSLLFSWCSPQSFPAAHFPRLHLMPSTITEPRITHCELEPLELLFMGREYPLGYKYFRERAHKAFASQKHLRDEEEIQTALRRAEWVRKGVCVRYS